MAENKKFWYIQLNVNFFEDERIDWLCEQANGYAYVVLYLKLCLKTANNNGILTRKVGNMIIPYDVDKIAEITHMNVDVVRVAFELYKNIGLIYEADENCNFMRLPEVPKMVGCITQAALDKRKQRGKSQAGERDKVGQLSGQCPDNVPDIVAQELRVKSLELRDKSLDKQGESESVHEQESAQESRFFRFWSVYPKKKSKQAAFKAWQKLKPDEAFTQKIIAAVQKQKQWPEWQKNGGQYIPYPATWLNSGGWDDEPDPKNGVVEDDYWAR